MKKAIPRKMFLSLAVVMLATLVAAPMVLASPDATATRTLPATSVAPGAQFDVGIVASGAGFGGEVRETLPNGFTYVMGSCSDPNIGVLSGGGQVMRFTFQGASADFSYTVQASATEDTYPYTGVVIDDLLNQSPVGGDDEVTVSDVDTYTLTIAVSPTLGGTTNPTAGTHDYADGTLVTIYATAATGYEFSHWSGDASGTSSPTTVTMTADKSVTANFEVSTTPQSFAWWLYETYIEPYM